MLINSLVTIEEKSEAGVPIRLPQPAEALSRRLHLILEHTTDYVGTCDLQGNLLYHNPAALDMVGLPRNADLTGLQIRDMHPEWGTDLLVKTGIPVALREGVWRGENAVLHRSGREIPVTQVVMAHRSPTGEVQFLSTIMRDISEEKRHWTERDELLERISRSNVALDQIIRCSGNMIVATEVDGTIRHFNAEAEKKLGYRAEEVVGKMTPKIFHDGGEMIRRAEALSLELGRPVSPDFRVFVEKAEGGVTDQNEWTYIRKDGSRFPVLLSVTAMRNSKGNIDGYLGTIADLTEQKRLESEILRAYDRSNRALEQFALVAAHDMQAPLRHINMFCRLISNRIEPGDDSELKELLKFVIEGADRLKELTSDLLSYSRVNAKRVPETISLNRLVREVIEMGGLASNETTFRIGPLPEVLGYRYPIRQLLQNLLQNAVKFRASERLLQIDVTGDETAEGWIVSVRDNGIGIEAQHFDRVFQRFERIDPNGHEGTGLGLAICRKVADLHGGRIWVESTPENGTVFHFSWPRPRRESER